MRFPGGSAFLELLSGDFSKKSQHTLNRGHRLAPRAWHVVTSKHEKADAKREKKKKKKTTNWVKTGGTAFERCQRETSSLCHRLVHRNTRIMNQCWTPAELSAPAPSQRAAPHDIQHTHALWPLQSSKHTRQSAVECCVCWVNHYAVLHLAAFREQRGFW